MALLNGRITGNHARMRTSVWFLRGMAVRIRPRPELMESLVIKWWLGIDGLVVVLPASALVFFGMQEVDAGSFNQQP